jgi:hypothetical protein
VRSLRCEGAVVAIAHALLQASAAHTMSARISLWDDIRSLDQRIG